MCGGSKGEVVAVVVVVGGVPESGFEVENVEIRRKVGGNNNREHDYIKMEKNKGRDRQKLRSRMYS